MGWFDDEGNAGADPNADPYQYADYTNPDGSQHTYEPPVDPPWDPSWGTPVTTGPGSAGQPGVAFYNGGPGPGVLGNLDNNGISWQIVGPNGPVAVPPGTPGATPSAPGAPGAPGRPGTPGSTFPAPNIPDPSGYPAPRVPGYGQAPHVPMLDTPVDPLAPWTGTFEAPTKDSILNDPEFQARLDEGMKTIQRSAAAKGTLLTGGTLKGLDQYGQQEAGKAYGNAYNRAYNEYDTRRTDFLTNEANRFSSQKQNALDKWAQETDVFNMERANRGDTFGMDSGIFNMENLNRMNSWGIAGDYFNMGRTNRMDDFNIYRTSDMDNWTKQYNLAQLGRPSAPNVNA